MIATIASAVVCDNNAGGGDGGRRVSSVGIVGIEAARSERSEKGVRRSRRFEVCGVVAGTSYITLSQCPIALLAQ